MKCFTAISMALACGLAQCQADRATFERIYREYAAALKTAKGKPLVDWYLKYSTPEFRTTASNGKSILRKDLLPQLERSQAIYRRFESVESTVLSITRTRDVVVTVRTKSMGLIFDKKRKTHLLGIDSSYLDTWRVIRGKLRLIEQRQLPSKATLDGRRLNAG